MDNLDKRTTFSSKQKNSEGSPRKAGFMAVTRLEDVQAVRSVAMHPTRDLYALGSNSKMLRVCRFPDLDQLRYTFVTYSSFSSNFAHNMIRLRKWEWSSKLLILQLLGTY